MAMVHVHTPVLRSVRKMPKLLPCEPDRDLLVKYIHVCLEDLERCWDVMEYCRQRQEGDLQIFTHLVTDITVVGMLWGMSRQLHIQLKILNRRSIPAGMHLCISLYACSIIV